MRLAAHESGGIALLMARTETETWFKTVWNAYAGALFLRGRLTFCRPDGTPGATNCGAPPVLIAYGDESLCRLRRSKLDGHLILHENSAIRG